MAPKTAEEKLSAKTNHDLIVKLVKRVEDLEKNNTTIVQENKTKTEQLRNLSKLVKVMEEALDAYADRLCALAEKVFTESKSKEENNKKNNNSKQAKPQGQEKTPLTVTNMEESNPPKAAQHNQDQLPTKAAGQPLDGLAVGGVIIDSTKKQHKIDKQEEVKNNVISTPNGEVNINVISKKTSKLEEFSRMQEIHRRRCNLVVHGLAEQSANQESKQIERILKLTSIKTRPSYSHRLGQLGQGKIRPIIIKFETPVHVIMKNFIEARKGLHQNDKLSKVYLTPDLTKSQIAERTELMGQVIRNRNEGKISYLALNSGHFKVYCK